MRELPSYCYLYNISNDRATIIWDYVKILKKLGALKWTIERFRNLKIPEKAHGPL